MRAARPDLLPRPLAHLHAAGPRPAQRAWRAGLRVGLVLGALAGAAAAGIALAWLA